METLHARAHEPAPSRDLIRSLLAAEHYPAVLDRTALALAALPDDAELYFARGTAFSALQRPEAAHAALTRAVVLMPGLAAGWLNLGNTCVDLGEEADAERHYRTAIRLDPTLAEAQASLGHLMMTQARLTEALFACETAVRLSPKMPQAHWNLASVRLLTGDLARGLPEYEWRKRHPAFRRDFPPLPGPYWSSGDPAGKVILVRAEQGFGDTIQFARFLVQIAQAGGTPVLQCDPKLVPLLARLEGVVVLPHSARVEGYDAWTDMMSLPLAMGADLEALPGRKGYLRAASPRAGGTRRRRVGLAWAGNPAQANDRRRSVPAAALAPLLAIPGIEFVNLQVGARARDLPLPDHCERLTDFGKTAALLETLDLVIAADTAVVHLAGAMGVPTWAMLAHVPDWRWLMGREDSPWYASMRLFRQDRPGDWAGVVTRIVADIQLPLPTDTPKG